MKYELTSHNIMIYKVYVRKCILYDYIHTQNIIYQ